MKITKAQLEALIREAASEYVYGVKNPGRVANKYNLSTLKQVIEEELGKHMDEGIFDQESKAERLKRTRKRYEGDMSFLVKKIKKIAWAWEKRYDYDEEDLGPIPGIDKAIEGMNMAIEFLRKEGESR